MNIHIEANTSEMEPDDIIALRDNIQKILDNLNAQIRLSKMAKHRHRK